MFSTRTRLTIALLALPFLIGAFSPQEHAGAQERNGKFKRHAGRRIPGQYIVTLREGAVSPQQALTVSAQAAVAAIADDMVARHGGRRRHVYGSVVKGFSARMTEEEARALSSDSRVAVVEEDGQVSIAGAQSSPQNWGWTGSIRGSSGLMTPTTTSRMAAG
jgi:hypothetical protein